ncbi:response regulator [Pseudoxanthomonas winnipegensis]|uniref:Response regulator n=1 Tax=Pseudoxanthomonas winnipegensis TaxID=2480810 RepID=A0A4Q8M501_9GAMM|nr:response regulator [Pseudoxanthomonas winnipegensis]TAA44838.1 response regulator [Pseudoxanthomonas winnipegensis]
MAGKDNRIVVVEDDDSVREAIVAYLGRHGFEVRGTADAAGLDALLQRQPADLVILDIMLPGEDGLSICRRLSQDGPPVLLLSALVEVTDRVVGLEVGAFDYLGKPFDPRELLARVRAILRRQAPRAAPPTSPYLFSGWVFEADAHRLTTPDRATLALTAGESRMLLAFVRHPTRVLSRDRLLDLTHEAAEGPFDRAIDLAVSRLRRRLAAAGGAALIETVRSLGYRFRAPVTRG